VLGAFTFSADLDFEPMLLSSTATVYTGLQTTSTNCLTDTTTWTYATKTVTKTYGPAFDDLTVEGSVSIAGLNFGGLFYLKGTDMDGSKTYSSWEFASWPMQFSQTQGATAYTALKDFVVPGTTKVGTGAKFTISGSFAGATITNYTYFNLVEYSDWAVSSYDVDHIATKLQMSGTLAGLECEGCNVMFTRNYTLIEGLAPFGDCLTVDLAIDFSCCDFEGLSILFKDISLGCCWDLSFDFLVEFDTISKTMTLEPEMTFASACFTIAAEVVYSSENVISGIELEGLSYTHTFDGVAVSFAATWDQTDNPLIGTSGTITHYGASKVFFWKPDTHAVDAEGKRIAAINASGAGHYVLDSAYCSYEQATVINKLSLDFDADACCGGLFDLDVDTYFGSVKKYTLQGIYGTYYVDDDCSGAWDEIDWLGPVNKYVPGPDTTANKAPTVCSSTSADSCDPCFTATTFKDYVKVDKDYDAGASIGGTILGWVESDADIVFGVGSNISLGLGIDVAWWGWENISFSVEFTW